MSQSSSTEMFMASGTRRNLQSASSLKMAESSTSIMHRVPSSDAGSERVDSIFKEIEGNDYSDDIKKYRHQFSSLITKIREK